MLTGRGAGSQRAMTAVAAAHRAAAAALQRGAPRALEPRQCVVGPHHQHRVPVDQKIGSAPGELVPGLHRTSHVHEKRDGRGAAGTWQEKIVLHKIVRHM